MIGLTELKAWLKISTAAYDAQLVALEERAVAIIERELRWYFGPPRSVTEVLNGTGTSRLFLHQPPSDGAVAVESRYGVGRSWTAVPVADFELDGRGLYAYSGYWARGERNYRATYLEGFDPAPKDVEQLVLDMVASVWLRRGTEGLASESIGDYSYSLGDLQSIPRWSVVSNAWARGRI